MKKFALILAAAIILPLFIMSYVAPPESYYDSTDCWFTDTWNVVNSAPSCENGDEIVTPPVVTPGLPCDDNVTEPPTIAPSITEPLIDIPSEQSKKLILSTEPHARPMPELMIWSTNGDFSQQIWNPASESHFDLYAGIVIASSLTIDDFLSARRFVILFDEKIPFENVYVTNIHSPNDSLGEFRRGMSLNHFLRQDDNKLIFDLAFLGAYCSSIIPNYALVFAGIENFNIISVYLEY